MKAKLFTVPWVKPELSEDAVEAVEIIKDNIWRDASIRFSAERETKIKLGKSAPKGMQKYLNEVLVERFRGHGWSGEAGYFVKNKTWVRITFRHQMSLGSDIIDAVKVCKLEGINLAIILAANRDTLNIISPNDAAAIVSYEKLKKEIFGLNGAIDIPLMIGELTPYTSASAEIDNGLKKERPRDKSIPAIE